MPSVISDGMLVNWIAGFLWPLFRVAGFFMTVPLIGSQILSANIRLLFTVVITLAILPMVPPVPQIDMISVQAFLVIAQQVMIGVAFGFVVQIVYQVFALAGQIFAMQAGLGFASMADPANGVNTTVMAQFLVIGANLLFVTLNGHLALIQIIADSFRLIPIGYTGIDREFFWELVNLGGWMFSAAFLIVLPGIVALLMVQAGLGIVTRAAPQLNIFSLGFPFMMVFSLFIAWLGMLTIEPHFQAVFEFGLSFLRDWIESRA
ncbi:flagellar biosynthetic protein FliR [Oceanospirillum multiglobuliferum]|uniref:Flagellar biosynthetic protein FliR n=1 Tax=Oceanospirillum multiglobuliferum TaxID=64969 RepID=A0A1T4L4Q0_9GAMM|nr:flagellar biosynthetic protein FliR [Oceanospirillum multiglobuliferum]OPX56801.1 flagellar biosynthetic protein FliR [Oceanospirillum multiglobuliferum]SJZ49684.1 flagellar biosynthetic protein FliR [Oceanospirillum multiglobuliferum]